MEALTKEQIAAHLNNLAIAVNQLRGSYDELVAVRKSYEIINEIVNEKVTNNTDTAVGLQSTQGFKAETDLQPQI